MSDALALLRAIPPELRDPWVSGVADLIGQAVARHMRGPDRDEDDTSTGALPLDRIVVPTSRVDGSTIARGARAVMVAAGGDPSIGLDLVGSNGRSVRVPAREGPIYHAPIKEIRLVGTLTRTLELLIAHRDGVLGGAPQMAPALATDDATAAAWTAGQSVQLAASLSGKLLVVDGLRCITAEAVGQAVAMGAPVLVSGTTIGDVALVYLRVRNTGANSVMIEAAGASGNTAIEIAAAGTFELGPLPHAIPASTLSLASAAGSTVDLFAVVRPLDLVETV